jgi:hypothetical protein
MCSEDSAAVKSDGVEVITASTVTCEHCSQPFQPHRGKRFCSSRCRVAFHNAKRGSETPPETPETPEPKVEDHFDWDGDLVLLEEQLPIAVYIGDRGHLVIRQRSDWNEENDAVILIAPQNISEFFDKLTDMAGIPCLPPRRQP